MRSQTLANIHEIFQNIYSYTCLVFRIAPVNILHHRNRNLMKHFEFLHGSRMICLPLNISEKFHYQHLFGKLGEAEAQELLNNNKDHSKKWGPRLFFHSDTNPVLSHVLAHSVDKTHVLGVTVELIWLLFLNILSFNFCPTPNKGGNLFSFLSTLI